MHCKPVWINSFSGVLGMMDGCAWRGGMSAAWVMAKRVWQVGAGITMGLAPLRTCLPLLLVAHSFLQNVHINTKTLRWAFP